MIWKWAIAVVVYFVAGFFVWRKMREEYEEEEILKLIMLLGLGVGVGAAVFGTWGAVGAGLAALVWRCRRKDWAFWEWLDAVAPAGLAAGALVSLNWVWGIGLAGVWAAGRWYRKWKWYKSGRPGLVGLTAMLVLAIGETAVANGSGFRLYWGGLELARWIGIWSAVAVGVAVWLRATKKA